MPSAFKLCTILFTLALTGCGSPGIEHYRDQTPKLDLYQWFAGDTCGWGMFQKRNGEVVKRFKVAIRGEGTPDALTLNESFSYADGSKDSRIWALTRTAANTWQGRAGDVVGEANGIQSGNALHWQYVLRLPVDDSTYDMQMDDWMYLIDADTLVNRTRMSKFGVDVGEVTLFFRRNTHCPAG
ncbi:DUF3833 domain-containing protein [Burkholderiaceae bacterium DAT-1]|nr:DUF3833 domain-containing protein [Burkholderiaceae bacterium DAT-1]